MARLKSDQMQASPEVAIEEQEVKAETTEAQTPEDDLAPGRNPFEGLKAFDLKPYKSSEELPRPIIKTHEEINHVGRKTVILRVVRAGRPRLKMEVGRWVNVIAVWRDVSGVSQKEVFTLKPRSQHRPNDKRLYELLKKRGVPETMVNVRA